MKKVVLPAIWLLVGIALGVPVMAGTYKAMADTSTPEFCGTCHEIQPAVAAWRTSTHVNNAQGVVTTCMDCHLPPPEDTVAFFTAKVTHGLKDYLAHMQLGEEGYDRAASRQAMYKSTHNDQCLKCHQNILYMPHNRGAMKAHRTVMYPRPGYEKTCFDCHRNLVHVDRTQYGYKQFNLPYQATGLRGQLEEQL